jgi:hypothetical protein
MFWQILIVFFIIGDFVIVQVIPFLSALNPSFLKVFLIDYNNTLITKISITAKKRNNEKVNQSMNEKPS